MNRMQLFLTAIGGLLLANQADARQVIVRKDLLSAHFGARTFDRIEIKEIDFSPGQKTGLHLHPGGTVGYVLSGAIAFRVDGEEGKLLRGGDAFFEPPNTRIVTFDNASTTEGATFLAFYLLEGNEPLITMLAS